jgi:hypothetical protein
MTESFKTGTAFCIYSRMQIIMSSKGDINIHRNALNFSTPARHLDIYASQQVFYAAFIGRPAKRISKYQHKKYVSIYDKSQGVH